MCKVPKNISYRKRDLSQEKDQQQHTPVKQQPKEPKLNTSGLLGQQIQATKAQLHSVNTTVKKADNLEKEIERKKVYALEQSQGDNAIEQDLKASSIQCIKEAKLFADEQYHSNMRDMVRKA